MSARFDMLKRLTEIDGKSKGPATTFTAYDAMAAILAIGHSGKIGRGKLGTELNMGPGAVRTLITKLKHMRYITISGEGCSLTKSGTLLFEEISDKLHMCGEARLKELSLGNYYFVIKIHNVETLPQNVLELRDEAVRAGAVGALLLRYNSGRLVFADSQIPCQETKNSRDWDILVSLCNLREGDLLAVAFAAEQKGAREGALAMGLRAVIPPHHA